MSKSNDSSDLERRINNTLQTLFDLIKSSKHKGVAIIGTTSNLSSVDSNLRRAGRCVHFISILLHSNIYKIKCLHLLFFLNVIYLYVLFRFDYEIELPIPNELQRKDILTKQLSQVKHEISEKEINYISYRSQGFVGADLLAVVNRALTEAAIKNENITYKHLCTATTQVKPSAIKEVLVQVPNVSYY